MSKKTEKICKYVALGVTVLLFLLIAIFIAVTFRTYTFNDLEIIIVTVVILLAPCLSFLFHETGHLVLGLLTGYEYLWFDCDSPIMLEWPFGKQTSYFRFLPESYSHRIPMVQILNVGLMSAVGTSGVFVMRSRNDERDDLPVLPYLLGGVLFNLLLSGLYAMGFALLNDVYKPLAFSFLISMLLSLLYTVNNGIPLYSGGVANDGMNAICLFNDPIAKDAYRKEIEIFREWSTGASFSKMPDELFILPEDADIQNIHCGSIAAFAAMRYFDDGDFVETEQAIADLLSSGFNITDFHKQLLICNYIFCRLYNSPTADVSNLITPELNAFLNAMRAYPMIKCIQYAIALRHEKDEVKANYLMMTSDFSHTQYYKLAVKLGDKYNKRTKKRADVE